MTEPLDLDAIEARHLAEGAFSSPAKTRADLRALVAEVRRVRARNLKNMEKR